jgi:hypothetical protein
VAHRADTGLLIVAHGSTVNPDSSAPTLAHAAEIRRREVFADVGLLVLGEFLMAADGRLLPAAAGIDTGKSQEVDHTKTFRSPALRRQRWHPIGLHAEVRVGI